MNKLLDRLGDLNPQLLREIKGKLKGRNIAIAISLSAIFQMVKDLYDGEVMKQQRSDFSQSQAECSLYDMENKSDRSLKSIACN